MFATTIWRLLLLIVLFGITNRTWGQRLDHYSIPIEQENAIRNGLGSNDRVSFCDDNIIDNSDFEDFGSLVAGSCNNIPQSCSVNTTFGCSSDRAPFQHCNFNLMGDWWVSHGTPEIWRENGHEAVLLWSGRALVEDGDNTIYGEGIYTYCYEFKAGNTYEMKLSMSVVGAPVTNFFVTLANGIDGPNDYQNQDPFTVNEFYELPSAVGASQNVFTNPGFSTISMVDYTFTFVPDQDYSILWFRPFQDDLEGDISYVYLDDICLSCDNPESTVVYTSNYYLPELTLASSLINARDQATIYSGQDVTFKCGQEILLESNFTAQGNSHFLATIGPVPECGGIACSPANTFAGDVDDRSDDGSEINAMQSEENLNQIIVYPNPSTGQFRVSFTPSEELSTIDLVVSNTLGKNILSLKEVADGTYLDLSNQVPGIYFLQIQSGNAQVTKRLIIQ